MSESSVDHILVAQVTGQPEPTTPIIREDLADRVEHTEAHETPEPSGYEPINNEPQDVPSNDYEPEAAVNEYGEEVKPERTFTQSEVEAMIRDRISRVKQPTAPGQDNVQTPQPNSPEGDDWAQQLETFIDQTLEKRQQRIEQTTWQQQQQEAQAQFEIKFNQGASRYSDFESVVMGKPLTPQMVVATRGLQDPAGFIYAAAKHQAGELERIAKIPDATTQAVEIGKLEERMRRAKSTVSNAPRPIGMVKGDVIGKSAPRDNEKSIDQKINEYETKQKKMRFGKI